MTPRAVAARAGLGALLLAVLALILVRPGGDDDPAATPPPGSGTASPSGVMPTATPATPPSEEAFCEAYRLLAAVQGQYVAQPDARGAELLRETADALLATGIPDSLRLPATAGYFVEISGIYGSLGQRLDPRAVPGAGDGQPVAGGSEEFASWLTTYCPAF